MTIDQCFIAKTFLDAVKISNGKERLKAPTMATLMTMRIDLTNIQKEFRTYQDELAKTIKTPRFTELQEMEERDEEQEKEFKELTTSITAEFDSISRAKAMEETSFKSKFTQEQYQEIMEVNCEGKISIQGNEMSAEDFLETIYMLFVAE